jgi:hypothetical protein
MSMKMKGTHNAMAITLRFSSFPAFRPHFDWLLSLFRLRHRSYQTGRMRILIFIRYLAWFAPCGLARSTVR